MTIRTQEIVPGSSIDKVVVQEDGKASNVDEEKITIDQKVAPINENENESHENVDNKASGKNHLEKLMAALQSPDDVYCLQL